MTVRYAVIILDLKMKDGGKQDCAGILSGTRLVFYNQACRSVKNHKPPFIFSFIKKKKSSNSYKALQTLK